MYKLDLEKKEEPEIKLPSVRSQKKQENSREISTSVSLTTLKPLTVWIITNCRKSLKRWEYHTLTCLLRNLYTGQAATVRTRCGTMDWFKNGKGVHQGCILSPCLHVAYLMRNAGLDEAQAGIKISRRNINNLRYTYDTTLMAESEEELKSLLMRVKEESKKVCLKFSIQKTNIMASGPITSWQIDGETMETVTDFIFLGSKITVDGCSHDIKRHLLFGKKAMTKLESIVKSRDIILPTKVYIVKVMVFPVVMY